MYVQVSLHRQRELGSITVDGSDVVSGRPAGPYVGLDIAQEVLFLGGLPAGMPPRGILRPGERVGSTHHMLSFIITVYIMILLMFNHRARILPYSFVHTYVCTYVGTVHHTCCVSSHT